MAAIFKPGQHVEVLWHRHGWLAGTFDGYCAGEPDEEFQRCLVAMDNGFSCRAPGFHPDCVREAVSVDALI